ncbi:4'-phosphopantetheinyl transferase superfamily protein [Massilia forsythiae]|uniref:Enterobactin synthase component D n=1 Tax=Massilia forsythiae TaxID=2728020 RepID=A0A7Z2VYF2_9BURK|nr:4'-phosphopantetheinyl transferase superfamily protein [Massilia forsythiae]QJE01534.1 4'-phosphopantetheinyl transferase superfamily protein [Massilia forsythiae]
MSLSVFMQASARPLPGATGLAYVTGRYCAQAFTPALFARGTIDFPPSIRASVPSRQAEFLAGRLCARMALAPYGLQDCAVASGSHREPLWPSGMTGSITHNASHAAAVACPVDRLGGIGIDLETVANPDALAAVAALAVSPHEHDYLLGLAGGGSADRLLTLAFSAKESFFKAAFGRVGAYFDFDAAEVLAIDQAGCTIALRCTGTLGPGLEAGSVHLAHYALPDQATVFTALALPA